MGIKWRLCSLIAKCTSYRSRCFRYNHSVIGKTCKQDNSLSPSTSSLQTDMILFFVKNFVFWLEYLWLTSDLSDPFSIINSFQYIVTYCILIYIRSTTTKIWWWQKHSLYIKFYGFDEPFFTMAILLVLSVISSQLKRTGLNNFLYNLFVNKYCTFWWTASPLSLSLSLS